MYGGKKHTTVLVSLSNDAPCRAGTFHVSALLPIEVSTISRYSLPFRAFSVLPLLRVALRSGFTYNFLYTDFIIEYLTIFTIHLVYLDQFKIGVTSIPVVRCSWNLKWTHLRLYSIPVHISRLVGRCLRKLCVPQIYHTTRSISLVGPSASYNN